jgi:hypothetical protein
MVPHCGCGETKAGSELSAQCSCRDCDYGDLGLYVARETINVRYVEQACPIYARLKSMSTSTETSSFTKSAQRMFNLCRLQGRASPTSSAADRAYTYPTSYWLMTNTNSTSLPRRKPTTGLAVAMQKRSCALAAAPRNSSFIDTEVMRRPCRTSPFIVRGLEYCVIISFRD